MTSRANPFVRDSIEFLKETDESAIEVIITQAETAVKALQGKTGTLLTR